jgi:hypothetical protein
MGCAGRLDGVCRLGRLVAGLDCWGDCGLEWCVLKWMARGKFQWMIEARIFGTLECNAMPYIDRKTA